MKKKQQITFTPAAENKDMEFIPDERAFDPTVCQCTGVVRRWDTDGLIETVDGVSTYRCSVCGKGYKA